jgi:hypothetical protein
VRLVKDYLTLFLSYERATGRLSVQWQVRQPTVDGAGATPDGRVEATGAVFAAKSISAPVVLRGSHRQIR